MKGIFAILAVGLTIAAAFSGCIGGGNEPVIENREFSILATNSTGALSFGLVVDTIKETITAETRADVSKRQRSSTPEITFAVNISNPDFISACAWSFGDGQTGTGLEAKCTYATPGAYRVIANVTFKDGLTGTANISASVNYHAECQDAVSGVPTLQYDKITGDEYWDYLFPMYAGAKRTVVETKGDPADTPVIPDLGTGVVGGDNDIAIEVYSPSGKQLGTADAGDPGTDEIVEFKKTKEVGNYYARIGCYGADPVSGGHMFVNTGSVSYFVYIDVFYS